MTSSLCGFKFYYRSLVKWKACAWEDNSATNSLISQSWGYLEYTQLTCRHDWWTVYNPCPRARQVITGNSWFAWEMLPQNFYEKSRMIFDINLNFHIHMYKCAQAVIYSHMQVKARTNVYMYTKNGERNKRYIIGINHAVDQWRRQSRWQPSAFWQHCQKRHRNDSIVNKQLRKDWVSTWSRIKLDIKSLILHKKKNTNQGAQLKTQNSETARERRRVHTIRYKCTSWVFFE